MLSYTCLISIPDLNVSCIMFPNINIQVTNEIDSVPLRLAFFWLSNYLSDIISAFLATGILQLRGVAGKEGWRYLFLLEGILTLIIGVITFFMMPAGPTQTKTWFRQKGWFTERSVSHSQSVFTARTNTTIIEIAEKKRLWSTESCETIHQNRTCTIVKV